MKISKIEHFQGNGFLIIKLALSFGPTPVRWTSFTFELPFFVALDAIGILRLSEGLGAVVAHPAVLVLSMGFFGHLQILLLHGEDLGVTVRAFQLLVGYVVFMAEGNRVRSLGGELDFPSAHLLGLGEGRSQSGNADDQGRDDEDFPDFHSQILPPFSHRIQNIPFNPIF
jgi:hypothetical protein